MSSRFKYLIEVEAGDWKDRETYKEWLSNNIGPRGIGWSFMWRRSTSYIVKTTDEADMLAFRLRFAC